MNTQRGLGRGLEALIPGEEGANERGVLEVRWEDIQPNPHQPRAPIDENTLSELAASIREHGILQPLVVSRAPEGGYILIAGERRWRAARLAGLTRVPVLVKDVAPQQMLELALVENIQRADLNPLEEALAYKQLIEEFGLSQSEVAQRVGKSRVAVTNTLRLLQAAPAVREALMTGQISEGHARALLGCPDPQQQEALLELVLHHGLNVRQTEALVKRAQRTPALARPSPRPAPDVRALEESFQKRLGTRVRLHTGPKGGRLVIYFYSNEELQTLYRQITGEEL